MKYLHAICLIALAGTLCGVSAQIDRGTIEGSVTDPSGAAIPAAQVEIVQMGTNSVTRVATNEVGRYFVPNLPLGTYRVIVRKEGFRAAIREPILIQAQTRARADFALQIGPVAEAIEVTAQAPILDVSTPTLATGITTKYIGELPLIQIGSRRDITAFLRYLPGLASESGQRLDGANAKAAEVFIDGAPASYGNSRGQMDVNGPAIEQVGEFNIMTHAFNAEYGRTGSWLTNITVRSGSNQWHGSVFNYLANDAFNARSFFQKDRTRTRQNEGGFTLGGPAYLPKIYNGRDRTFFFFGHQLFYNRAIGRGDMLTIPGPDFRRGDFSNLRDANGVVIPIYDPATTRPDGQGSFVRDQFAGNIIPAARISPVSRKIIDLMPAPDLPNKQSENWFNRTGNNPRFDTFVTTAKVDHNVSDKQKITVMYSNQLRPRLIAGRGWGADTPLEGFQAQDHNSRTGRIQHDYVFRPALLNHLTIGIDRSRNMAKTATIGQGWDQKLGIQGLPWDAGGFPAVIFSGGTASPIQISDERNSITASRRVSISDNLTWVRGRHNMKFGLTYYRENQNSFEGKEASGYFTFSNTTTSQPNAGANFTRWGSSTASFLLGETSQARTRSPLIAGPRFPYWALFAQDEWHANSRLTLSYGLRWDFTPAVFEVNDILSSFDPNTPNPGAGGRLGALIFAGSGPGRIGRRRIADNWYRGFGPRLGLAYKVNDKTVVRGSTGIYYSPSLRSWLLSAGFTATPVFPSPDGFSPAYNWNNIFPQNFPRPPFIDPSFQNGQAVDWTARDNARSPQIHTWTFGIQRELSPNLVLDISYLGHHGTHLSADDATSLAASNVVDPRYLSLGSLLTQRINSAAARAAGIALPFSGFENYTTNTVAQALMPYPQYTTVTKVNAPVGISRFHSLQVKATKRYSRGLTLLAFWTWQKNMTNAEGGSDAIQNPLDRAGEVSIGKNTGAPHTLVCSAAYELPLGPGKRFLNWAGPAGRVFGGWQVVAYVRRAAGVPLTMTTGNNLSIMGYPTKRANYVAGQPIHLKSNPRDFNPAVDTYLNPKAFAIPGSYELGNTARALDWARGWTFKNESVSIGKRTRITEKLSTMLRADVENPFNFVRWSNPTTDRSSANFGRVTSTQAGRVMQLSLAVEF